MTSNIGAQSQGFFAFTDLGSLVAGLVNAAIIVSAIVCLMFIIIGGFNWLTSGGDKTKTEAAQKTITNALIGLIIVVAGFAAWIAVRDFLGLTRALPLN